LDHMFPDHTLQTNTIRSTIAATGDETAGGHESGADETRPGNGPGSHRRRLLTNSANAQAGDPSIRGRRLALDRGVKEGSGHASNAMSSYEASPAMCIPDRARARKSDSRGLPAAVSSQK